MRLILVVVGNQQLSTPIKKSIHVWLIYLEIMTVKLLPTNKLAKSKKLIRMRKERQKRAITNRIEQQIQYI